MRTTTTSKLFNMRSVDDVYNIGRAIWRRWSASVRRNSGSGGGGRRLLIIIHREFISKINLLLRVEDEKLLLEKKKLYVHLL